MAQQNQPITKIPAVRTYAKDLEINREAAGLSPSEKETSEVKKSDTSAKIPAAPSASVKQIYKGPSIMADVPAPKKEVPRPAPKKLTSFTSKNTTFVVDNEDAASATIITDTKKDRFKLLPSVITSIKTWFENKKLAYAKKKAPKYTVPETTRRKGVIQKATSSTGRFATSDFGSIQDRIKQRKLEDEKPEPGITWSANTEPGFALLTSGTSSQVTNVKVEERKSYKNIAIPIVLKEEKEPVKVAEEPLLVIEPIEEPAALPAEELIEEEIVEEVELAEPEPEEEYVDEEIVEEKATIKQKFELLSLDTNTLALGVAGLILALIIFGIYGYYTFIATPTVTPVMNETKAAEQLLDIPIMEVTSVTASKTSVLSLIEANRPQGLGKGAQLSFLSGGANSSLIPPSILLSILNVDLEQNFTKSISTIRIGYTPELKKFIIIKTSNNNSTKGGLLLWEESMGTDLSDILDVGKPLSADISFVDARLGGLDVRVLKNEAGADEIIYGQINNLIIITEDTNNFTELTKLIK
jgi:hypothetical protein